MIWISQVDRLKAEGFERAIMRDHPTLQGMMTVPLQPSAYIPAEFP